MSMNISVFVHWLLTAIFFFWIQCLQICPRSTPLGTSRSIDRHPTLCHLTPRRLKAISIFTTLYKGIFSMGKKWPKSVGQELIVKSEFQSIFLGVVSKNIVSNFRWSVKLYGIIKYSVQNFHLSFFMTRDIFIIYYVSLSFSLSLEFHECRSW